MRGRIRADRQRGTYAYAPMFCGAVSPLASMSETDPYVDTPPVKWSDLGVNELPTPPGGRVHPGGAYGLHVADRPERGRRRPSTITRRTRVNSKSKWMTWVDFTDGVHRFLEARTRGHHDDARLARTLTPRCDSLVWLIAGGKARPPNVLDGFVFALRVPTGPGHCSTSHGRYSGAGRHETCCASSARRCRRHCLANKP